MDTMQTRDGLLNTEQACNFLGIKKSRLRAAIFRREIPYIKIGRLVRFSPESLTTWLKGRTHEVGSAR